MSMWTLYYEQNDINDLIEFLKLTKNEILNFIFIPYDMNIEQTNSIYKYNENYNDLRIKTSYSKYTKIIKYHKSTVQTYWQICDFSQNLVHVVFVKPCTCRQ